MHNVFIHPTAEVLSERIGEGTRIWQYVVVLEGAVIGKEVNICAHALVENDVVIGDRVTVKSGVFLWDGVRLEDDVFVGANVVFVNDNFPRSRQYPESFLSTVVEKGASVGAGAVVLGGCTIGRGAMVGAGAVVTKSVPPYAVVKGNPARISGYVAGNEAPADRSLPPAQAAVPEEEGVAAVGIGEVTLHRMRSREDMRGKLIAGEVPRGLPFQPQRYFLVHGVPSVKTRGEHAHRRCRQFLTCVHGSCAVVVDDGASRCEIRLDAPDIGLYLPPYVWGIQYKFTPDAVLLVFASELYDPSDYIRDYGEFLATVAGRAE